MLLLACFIGLPTSVEFIKSDRKTFYINTASTVHMTTSTEITPRALAILLCPPVKRMIAALREGDQTFEELHELTGLERYVVSAYLAELEQMSIAVPGDYKILKEPDEKSPGLTSRSYGLLPSILGMRVEELRKAASFYEGLLSPASTE